MTEDLPLTVLIGKMQPLSKRGRVLLLHLSFWCVYLSFFLYQITSFQRGHDIDWSRIGIIVANQFTFALIVSYLNYFVFLPRFLKHKNLWRYLAEFALPFALVMLARINFDRFLMDGFSHHEEYLYRTRFVVQVITVNFFIVIFVAMLRFAEAWLELEAKRKEVENERLTAELNFLKAQINPHFLFNTLNNLYYLAFSKSDNTTEVIAKLSQMMRYMIYDSNYPLVPLSKEIEYMQNYISLERLRLNDQIPIQFQVKGETERVLIAPLIFITFLENAFKHGVTNNSPGAWVNVLIQLNGQECTYTVENKKLLKSGADKDEKSGIGLRNVKRRLELSYPGKYELTVNDQPDRYSVKLHIILS